MTKKRSCSTIAQFSLTAINYSGNIWKEDHSTCCVTLLTHTDESLLGQLQGESSGDLLQLAIGVILWVDFDAGFSASEGNVDAGTFERHQGRESFDFVLVDVVAVTNACFGCRMIKLLYCSALYLFSLDLSIKNIKCLQSLGLSISKYQWCKYQWCRYMVAD